MNELSLPDGSERAPDPHQFWMKKALDQAVAAYEQDEVPVGAVIVHENRVIAEAFNQREMLQDPTAHAEILAITQAAESLGSWRLLDCTLYVTLEPCPMCAGAIVQARIPRVVYGTEDPKGGACNTLFQITTDLRLNHQAFVIPGVMREDCRAILQEFFRQQRALGEEIRTTPPFERIGGGGNPILRGGSAVRQFLPKPHVFTSIIAPVVCRSADQAAENTLTGLDPFFAP